MHIGIMQTCKSCKTFLVLSEAFFFIMTRQNFSETPKILISNLNDLKKTKENISWEMIEFPFLNLSELKMDWKWVMDKIQKGLLPPLKTCNCFWKYLYSHINMSDLLLGFLACVLRQYFNLTSLLLSLPINMVTIVHCALHMLPTRGCNFL